MSTGECSFYRGDEVPRRTVRSSMAPAFGVAKGQGEDAELFRRSWRVSRCPRDRGRRTGAVGRVFVSGGQGRLSLMMATATVPPRAIEDV